MIFFSQLGRFGRLGNQLFQIASTIGIATANNTHFGFPQWQYNDVLIRGLPTYTAIPLPHFIFEETVRPFNGIPALRPDVHWDLQGYFQSYKYFEHVKEHIKNLFIFNLDIPKSDNVAIHVRRGDYLGLASIYPIPTMEYYTKAMEMFPGKRFSIFSDDIDWCKNNFDADLCDFVPRVDDFKELLYFSKHAGFIIANSSYSWWGAYLGNGEVVVPNRWIYNEPDSTIRDRIPPEWNII
jgi:hypothetical protein